MGDELMSPLTTTPLTGPNVNTLTNRLQAQVGAANKAGPAPGGDDAAMVQAAKDFESVLAARLVEELRSTIGESGLLDGPGSQQMQDMFWFHLAQDVSKSGGLGLWKQVYSQMKSASHPGPAPGQASLEHSV